jgi:beta-lactamase superfamily II metal-dependent hydrolase
MPATDVAKDLLGEAGGFVEACRPTDLIYFTLNVGDGDTQLLLLPENSKGQRRAIVVDCIRATKLFALIDTLVDAELLKQVEPLLALVVATHPHDDHIAGMAALLRRFGRTGPDQPNHIGEFWEPAYYHPSRSYLEMMRELEDLDISHLQPASGTTRYMGLVKLTVLAPGIELRNKFDSYGVNINDASIALKVEFPAKRTIERAKDRTYIKLPTSQALILGADAQTRSWAQVMVDFPQLDPAKTAVTKALRRARGYEPLNASVFKVPHHGSKHGLNLELVELMKPGMSIVSSVRGGGRYEFPHALTQMALREALDPISSKPGSEYKSDPALSILYTGSRELDEKGRPGGTLGTIAVLVGAGGRREVWRFGDGATGKVDLDEGRPMFAGAVAAAREPVPAIPRARRRGG